MLVSQGRFLEEVAHFMYRLYLTSVHLFRARALCSLPMSLIPCSSPTSSLSTITWEQTGVN